MSAPPRVIVPGAVLAAGGRVPLSEAEARHLKVSRVAPGTEVILLDGDGGRAAAVLSAGGREVVVTGLLPARGEPRGRVTVLLGVGEPARVEWAVEKGTECGAAAFLLVAAARSQRAHVAAAGARLERLARIAAEAVKQCDRTVVPSVAGPVTLEHALSRVRGRLLVARPGAPSSGRAACQEDDLFVAIGPEGGFDASEELLFDAAGALPLGLGGRILRLETAVVAALARLVDDDVP